MRVLAIVHDSDAGPGVFAEPIDAAGAWELVPWMITDGTEAPIDPLSADAVMTFGGAMHPDEQHGWMDAERALLAELLAAGIPTLGVCLGAQLLAAAAGSAPRRAPVPEIGWYEIEPTAEGEHDPLIGPLAPRFEAFEWHSYEIELPAGATALARSENLLQAYRIGDRTWGIQFHAEVTAEDAEAWIADHESDRDSVALGIDWQSLRAQTRASIPAWNDLGRGLSERFLHAAANGAR